MCVRGWPNQLEPQAAPVGCPQDFYVAVTNPIIMLKVGDTAPKFSLYDADRKSREMGEFLVQGKKTIIAFYPGAFTGVCTKELCEFSDMNVELQKLGATVVGISVDSPFANKAFADKYGLRFPLLSDYKREAIKAYDVGWTGLAGLKEYESSNRAIFIVDGSGKIEYMWIGENPGSYPDFGAIRKAL